MKNNSFLSVRFLKANLMDDLISYEQGDVSRRTSILRTLSKIVEGCRDTYDVSRRFDFSISYDACKVFYNFANYEKLAYSVGEKISPRAQIFLANESLRLLSQNVGNLRIYPF